MYTFFYIDIVLKSHLTSGLPLFPPAFVPISIFSQRYLSEKLGPDSELFFSYSKLRLNAAIIHHASQKSCVLIMVWTGSRHSCVTWDQLGDVKTRPCQMFVQTMAGCPRACHCLL